jgi:hypothetical protein
MFPQITRQWCLRQVIARQFERTLAAQMRLDLWAERREAISQFEQVQVAARGLKGIKAGKVLVVLIEAVRFASTARWHSWSAG